MLKNKRNLIQICLLIAVLLPALISVAQPVTKIAGGGYHSLILKGDGSFWAMGDNQYGQLGDGTTNNINLPEQIVASNVTAIAGGITHTLFLKSDGSLWAMGDNSYGQLGDGTTNNNNLPEQIVASNVTAVVAGGGHSLFLKSDGSLWAMGWNNYGQLGDGTYNNTNFPEMIVASNVTEIAGGYCHSLFLKSDGSLWAMGYDQYGQLGDGMGNGNYENGNFPKTNYPEEIVASNVTAIAAGQIHSLFLKSDGSLWVMGYDGWGALGDGREIYVPTCTNLPEQIVSSNVTAISGGYHSLFLKSDGSLWGMGENDNGELGDGTYNQANTPVQIVSNGVTAIAAGIYHTLFLKNDGSLWAMGDNQYGQLGDGTLNSTNRPEQIVAGTPGYNQISAQLLSGGNVSLSYMGLAGTNYELDLSFSLSPVNWMPQVTNSAGAGGVLVFTNTPNAATNNFWRIRSVP